MSHAGRKAGVEEMLGVGGADFGMREDAGKSFADPRPDGDDDSKGRDGDAPVVVVSMALVPTRRRLRPRGAGVSARGAQSSPT